MHFERPHPLMDEMLGDEQEENISSSLFRSGLVGGKINTSFLHVFICPLLAVYNGAFGAKGKSGSCCQPY